MTALPVPSAVLKAPGPGTPELPETSTRVTQWEVSCLPEDDVNRRHFTIRVQYGGAGRWAVLRHSRCLSADGTWNHESIPSEREDEWLAEHRFDLDTALQLAREAAPHMTVNGWTVTDVLSGATERSAR